MRILLSMCIIASACNSSLAQEREIGYPYVQTVSNEKEKFSLEPIGKDELHDGSFGYFFFLRNNTKEQICVPKMILGGYTLALGWPFSGIDKNGKQFTFHGSGGGNTAKFIDLEKVAPNDALEIAYRTNFDAEEVFGLIPISSCEKTDFIDATAIMWELTPVHANMRERSNESETYDEGRGH